MSYPWFLVFSWSIFIAAVIGWVRFQKIAPAFYPFLACIWLGAANEIISILLPRFGYSTMVNNNIYVLAEALLLIYQLYKWNAFGRYYKLCWPLCAALIVLWFIENILAFRLHSVSSYFRLCYSSVIVLLSIHVSSGLILTEKKSLTRNPVFMLCVAFILYFTYKILVEAFWLYGLSVSRSFRINVYSIMIWINLVTNLVYAIAILCLPRKLPFTMQY